MELQVVGIRIWITSGSCAKNYSKGPCVTLLGVESRGSADATTGFVVAIVGIVA